MPRSSSTRSSSSSPEEPLVRKALLIETLGASFVQGQQCLGGPRRDTALFKEEQLRRLSAARSLLASYSSPSSPSSSLSSARRRVVRPSLLTSPASAAAFALGAVTALAASALPAAAAAVGGAAAVSRARGLVSRALEGAASDSYNGSLSALHQARAAAGGGAAADDERLRAVLRELRDAKRAPDYGGGFAASSPFSSSPFSSSPLSSSSSPLSWEEEEERGAGSGRGDPAKAFSSSSLEGTVDAAVSAAEAAIRAAAGLVFRAGEKL